MAKKSSGGSGALAVVALAILVLIGLKKPTNGGDGNGGGDGGYTSVSVHLASNPSGAFVHIKGTAEISGYTPFVGVVPPGNYTAEVSLSGYETKTIQFTVTGEAAVMELETVVLRNTSGTLSMAIEELTIYIPEYGVWWYYPNVHGRITNNSQGYVVARRVDLYRRYYEGTTPYEDHSPDPAMWYGEPQSPPLSPVTLTPGEYLDFYFVGSPNLLRGFVNEVWLRDMETGDVSNIMTILA